MAEDLTSSLRRFPWGYLYVLITWHLDSSRASDADSKRQKLPHVCDLTLQKSQCHFHNILLVS